MTVSLRNLTDTWNAGGTTFTAIKMDVTNTASAADSKLLDLQLGGSSKFSVDKNGDVEVPAGYFANFSGPFLVGAGNYGDSRPAISLGQSDGIQFYNTNFIGFSAGPYLIKASAAILDQRDGTNAQSFRVYRSFSDSSNYSRLAINDNQIKSEVAGTGTLTQTTDRPILDLAQTWNAGAVTFTALKANITNTASAADSKLIDLQVGGASKFQVVKDFAFQGYSAICMSGDTVNGIFNGPNGFVIGDVVNSRSVMVCGQVGFGASLRLDAPLALAWNTGSYTSGADTGLWRDAAGIIAQRNSTNAQTFRLYNTYTDASNYERGALEWSSNVLKIGAQKAGSGSGRDVTFVSTSTTFNFSAVDVGGHASVNFLNNAGTSKFNFYGLGAFSASSDSVVGWANNTTAGGQDIAMSRIAAGVVGIGTGAAQNISGWMQWGGQKRVSSDFSKTSSATLSDVTGLSVDVQAGRTYSFEAFISYTCAAAGGVRAAIGGTATATNIIYDGWIIDSAANGIKGNAQATALAGVVANAATTGTAGHIIIRGTITVNAAGTLTVQFAQSVSNGTASVAKRGSYFIVHDVA